MADKDKPESGAEGTKTGDEGTTAGSGGSAGTGAAEDSSGTKVLTLTQEQLDAIIERRLAKAKDPELERKAKAYDDAQAEQQTEADRLKSEKEAAEKQAQAAIEAANSRLKSAEIRLEAAKQGIRPEAADLVVEKLLTSEEIEVDDKGQVTGVSKAVEDLLKAHDYLKAPTETPAPKKSGGEFGGADGKTIDQQIAELEAKGDRASLAEARHLKLRKYESGKSK